MEFTQIIDQLISSGLSIKDSLEICSLINKKQNNIAAILFEQIKKGISFADAVSNMNSIFPEVYRGIISVGNRIGSVEKIFPRLRYYLETQKKLKDKLLGALLYPIIVLLTTLIVFISLIFFVFPKLKIMFSEFGGDAAHILEQNISTMERSFIFIFTIFVISFLIILFLNLFSTYNPDFKIKLDFIKLKIPLLGKFFTYLETLNFVFAMETLLSGGLTIEDAILESESVLSNKAYKNALDDIKKRITRGEALSQAFNTHKNIIPDYMCKWMLVSEHSGKSFQVFSQLRNYFQNEIDLYTSKFMALIEPILIILIGLFLILLIFNIIVPVFSLYGSIM